MGSWARGGLPFVFKTLFACFELPTPNTASKNFRINSRQVNKLQDLRLSIAHDSMSSLYGLQLTLRVGARAARVILQVGESIGSNERSHRQSKSLILSNRIYEVGAIQNLSSRGRRKKFDVEVDSRK